jgi:glycerol-3-phosphate cytidylyltransferase-like family protein
MKVAIAGTFDFRHKGHEQLLDYGIAMQVDCVWVTSDKFVAEKKTPKHKDKERIAMVREYLDNKDAQARVVKLSDAEKFTKQLTQLAPCVLLHGSDHNVDTLSKIYNVDNSWWLDNQIYLLYKDRFPGVSSTSLRENIEKSKKEWDDGARKKT